MKIIETNDAFEAKSIGNSIVVRKDWDKIKYDKMLQGLWAKFTQHSNLKEKLLETGNKIIHEYCYNDTYWGFFGTYGEDKLGKALMEIRDKIRNIDGWKN